MVYGTPDEDSVTEFSDLDGHDWLIMPLITNRFIEGEKLLNQIRNMNRTNDVMDEPRGAFRMVELNTGVVASYVNVAVLVGVKTAGERREKRKRFAQGLLEKGNE